jgi:opacity protein-like surface antigen
MNYFRKGLIAALVLCSASAVCADPAPDVQVRDSIFINVGATTPLNPGSFTTTQNVGYNGGLGYGFGLSKLFQLVIEADSDNFPLNNSLAPYNGASGGNIRIGTLLANARFRFLAEDNPVVPYVIGGMGAARVEQEAITSGGSVVSPTSSTANLALRLGIGIDIRLSGLTSLYVESSGYGIAGSNGASNINYNSFRLGGKFNL